MDNVFSRKDLGLMRISAFRDFPFDGENPVGLSRKQRQLSRKFSRVLPSPRRLSFASVSAFGISFRTAKTREEYPKTTSSASAYLQLKSIFVDSQTLDLAFEGRVWDAQLGCGTCWS
jgi:hypothetical protein